MIGTFQMQNFSISGMPNSIYYLYISSNSLVFPKNWQTLPNERYVENYYYYLPVKLDICQKGEILTNNSNGY